MAWLFSKFYAWSYESSNFATCMDCSNFCHRDMLGCIVNPHGPFVVTFSVPSLTIFIATIVSLYFVAGCKNTSDLADWVYNGIKWSMLFKKRKKGICYYSLPLFIIYFALVGIVYACGDISAGTELCVKIKKPYKFIKPENYINSTEYVGVVNLRRRPRKEELFDCLYDRTRACELVLYGDSGIGKTTFLTGLMDGMEMFLLVDLKNSIKFEKVVKHSFLTDKERFFDGLNSL